VLNPGTSHLLALALIAARIPSRARYICDMNTFKKWLPFIAVLTTALIGFPVGVYVTAHYVHISYEAALLLGVIVGVPAGGVAAAVAPL
jgi:hypothetical protein